MQAKVFQESQPRSSGIFGRYDRFSLHINSCIWGERYVAVRYNRMQTLNLQQLRQAVNLTVSIVGSWLSVSASIVPSADIQFETLRYKL